MSHKFDLNLSRHCIETEIKRLHNRLISRYLNLKKRDAQLEEKIEMLEMALKHFDFSMLRSKYPELAGNKDPSAHLLVDSDHNFQIHLNHKLVHQMNLSQKISPGK